MYAYQLVQNTPDSQQSAPWAIVCFLPYVTPDTFHVAPSSQTNDIALDVNKLVVASDPLNITVSTAKGGVSHNASIELAGGDLNYQALISPGDHVMIWMHNDPGRFDDIYNRVTNLQQANAFDSGLKFIGKVNSVREVLTVAPSGEKTLRYQVSCRGFTEFESMIYFNPVLAQGAEDPLKFYARVSDQWYSLLAKANGGAIPCGDIVQFLIEIFLGQGPSKSITSAGNVSRSPNNAFLIPDEVAQLLGMTQKSKLQTSYSDILQTIIGIQSYSTQTFLPDVNDNTVHNKVTTNPLAGVLVSLPDNFSNVSLWSLLDAHKNSTINEMYATLRVNESNNIFPTLIVRQLPYTSIFFQQVLSNYFPSAPTNLKATNFLDVPQWVISEDLVIGQYNIGTTDSARFNFLQAYGQLLGHNGDPQTSMQQQIIEGNFAIDTLDVIRTGGRNLITTSNADIRSTSTQTVTNIQEWAALLSDWWINGHLKLNGSLTVAGIMEPVAIGDNLQYDGRVFHIESITHQYTVTNSSKQFNTTFSMSNGVLADGSYGFTAYHNRAALNNANASATTNTPGGNLPGYSDEEQTSNNQVVVSSSGQSNKTAVLTGNSKRTGQ